MFYSFDQDENIYMFDYQRNNVYNFEQNLDNKIITLLSVNKFNRNKDISQEDNTTAFNTNIKDFYLNHM